MINIRISHIRLIGYGLLLTNVILFFGTWLRWYIGFPAVCLLLLGSYILMKNINTDQTVICISKKKLLLICGVMLAWTVISGLGGAFPQKSDLYWRNAILHDLINYSWPVHYMDGYDSALTYYMAFWLVPAMVGKLATFLVNAQFGWIAANIAYMLYCACILGIVLLLLISYFKATSLNRILLVLIVLIFFSGMDIIPTVLQQLGLKNISIGTHLEWWTEFQYSSNTTQLCWVFNQAIPAWLVTSLFLHEQRMKHYAFLGLLLLPYGPLPFFGLLFVMLILALGELLNAARKLQLPAYFRQIFTMPNIIAVITIFPIFYLYYRTNTAVSNNGFRFQFTASYFPFILIEFLVYAILIGRDYFKDRLYLISVLGLFLCPMFAIGSSQDFCMRASIPLLFIFMTFVTGYLLNNIIFCTENIMQIDLNTFILIMFLSLGALTPLTEYRESYTQTVGSQSNITALRVDRIGTLGDGKLGRDNFITMNASDSLFYRYLARPNYSE